MWVLSLLGCFPELSPPQGITDVPWRDYDGDGFALQADCDDDAPEVFEGAPELDNGMDDDCDGLVDEGWDTGCPTRTWFLDQDQDGWGDPEITFEACEAPLYSVEVAGDCEPSDPFVHPDAEEICGDDVDQNCVPGDCGAWAMSVDDATLTYVGDPGQTLGYAALIADLDDDGRLDLVAGAQGDDTVGDYSGAVLLWTSVDLGAGTMGTPLRIYPPVAGGSFGQALAFADVDGAEGQELLIGSPGVGDGVGAVYQWSGGTVTEYASGVGTWSGYGATLAVGAFFGAGAEGLLVGAQSEDVDSVDQGATYVYPNGSSEGTRAVVGQGDHAYAGYDVIALSVGGAHVAVIGEPGYHREGVASGGPGRISLWTPASTITHTHGSAQDAFGANLTSGDVDGDGDDDLVASALLIGEVAIYDVATWTPLAVVSVPPANGEHHGDLALCDMNGDGALDLAIAASSPQAGGAIWVALGPLQGALVPDLTIQGTAENPLGTSLSCEDLDEDGFDDLFAGTAYDANRRGAVYVFRGGRD